MNECPLQLRHLFKSCVCGDCIVNMLSQQSINFVVLSDRTIDQRICPGSIRTDVD